MKAHPCLSFSISELGEISFLQSFQGRMAGRCAGSRLYWRSSVKGRWWHYHKPGCLTCCHFCDTFGKVYPKRCCCHLALAIPIPVSQLPLSPTAAWPSQPSLLLLVLRASLLPALLLLQWSEDPPGPFCLQHRLCGAEGGYWEQREK